jgi:hypothetical protein
MPAARPTHLRRRRPRRRARNALATLALLAPAGVLACAEDTDTGDALCDARAELSNGLGDMVDVTDDVSIDEAYDDVSDALGDLRDAAGEDLDDEWQALEDAVLSLDDAVTDSDGASTSERLEVLGDSIGNVGAALDDLVRASGRDCP